MIESDLINDSEVPRVCVTYQGQTDHGLGCECETSELSVEGKDIKIKNLEFLRYAHEALKEGNKTKASYWLRRAVGLRA